MCFLLETRPPLAVRDTPARMLPDLSRLTLGPSGPPGPPGRAPEPTAAPERVTRGDFVEEELERARAARQGAAQARQADARVLERERRRFPQLHGTRTYPGVLKSTEQEHLQIAALMCYTKGWDQMLNKWLSGGLDTTPPSRVFKNLVRDSAMIGLKEAQWCMYAMFMDDSEFLRYLTGGEPKSPLQFSVDPVLYCSLGEGFKPLERLQMQVSSMPIVVISADGQSATTRQVVPTAKAIFDGVKNLLRTLFNEYDPARAAAASLFNGAVKNMMRQLYFCFEPISSYKVAPCDLDMALGAGKYVVYRGATLEREPYESRQDAARVDPMTLVSTSRSIDTAAGFVDGEIADCCLNVFLLDPACHVIDVNAFMGTAGANKNLTCYEDECELIIHPGSIYEKLGSTDQALQNQSIAQLIRTKDYRITEHEMAILRAQDATWWLVRPHPPLEDSDED